MIIGVVATLVGLVMWSGFAPKWLGRLPGDIRIEREHSAFYFPIVTCIILSIRAQPAFVALLNLPALNSSTVRFRTLVATDLWAVRSCELSGRMRTAHRAVATATTQNRLDQHVRALLRCRRCPRMQSTPVSGGAIVSDVMIIGQAPGPREPVLQRPFAHTAGKTLFRWFEEFCGMDEAAVRSKIYFAAVCRCFPGKNSGGSDRVPAPDEIRNCSSWMDDEIQILQPRLIIPVGRLAIAQFIDCAKLEEVIGRKFRVERAGHSLRPDSAAASIRRLALAQNSAGKSTYRTRAQIDRAPSCDRVCWINLETRNLRIPSGELFTLFLAAWFPDSSFSECLLHIPTRADIPESDKWDLTHLFADVSKWQEDFAWLQRAYPKLEQWKGRVGESAQTLADVLEFEKSLELKIERVYHYASLQLAEDSTNNEYLTRIGQVQNLLTKIGEAAAFVVPEIQAIDRRRFAKFPCRSGAERLADQAAQNSPNEAACAFRARGTPARAGQCRAQRLRRHFFATYRCGHEVRRA